MTKKISLIILAVAGLLISCKKENDDVPSGTPVDVIINDASQNGNSWKNGDQIKALFDNTVVTLTNKADNGAAASFKGTVKSDDYSLVKAFSPASCFISKGTGTTANVAIPSSQQPTLTGVDARADFWVAVPLENVAIGGGKTLSTTFSRATAIVKVVLKDTEGAYTGKTVTSVSLGTKNANISGAAVLDLANGSFACTGGKSVSAAYATGFAIDGTNAAWLAVAPATFANDEVLTISLKAGDDTPSMDINCADKQITGFAAGEVTTIEIEVAKGGLKGTGTQADPWQISNYADLCTLSSAVANGTSYSGEYIKLMADITAPEGQVFTPIGCRAKDAEDTDHPFNGKFDGNGKKISGLTIDDVANAGLFGYVSRGGDNETVTVEIKNLTIDGLKYTVNNSQEDGHAAIVGYTSSHGELVIDNCTVSNSTIKGKGSIGGIIAKVSGKTTITNCKVSGTTKIGGANSGVGGVAGIVNTTSKVEISGCAVGSKVEVTGTSRLGGIVGMIDRVKTDVLIDKCAVYGKIIGSQQIIGGIVGAAGADIDGNDKVVSGGISVIANCLFQGIIACTYTSTTNNAMLGGIVGFGTRTKDTDADEAKRGMSVHILNCASRPVSVSCPNQGEGTWSFGGISGAMFASQHAWNCWCDVTMGKMTLNSANKKYGAITTHINPESTYGNTAKFCFGVIQLKGMPTSSGKIFSGDGGNGEEAVANETANMTVADMSTIAEGATESKLLTDLKAGKTAYEALPAADQKATLSEWSEGTDGYPAMSTTPADPDK